MYEPQGIAMENESLVLDLLEWIAKAPRPYNEVMEAWRTSCPRFSIWEDALDAGLITKSAQSVFITAEGEAFLLSRRPKTH